MPEGTLGVLAPALKDARELLSELQSAVETVAFSEIIEHAVDDDEVDSLLTTCRNPPASVCTLLMKAALMLLRSTVTLGWSLVQERAGADTIRCMPRAC